MNEGFFDVFVDKSKSSDPHEQYVALMFALQLPSICSRIEFPRYPENSGGSEREASTLYVGDCGKPIDRRLYIEWMRMHKHQFRCWWLKSMPFEVICRALYDLRDCLLRTGSLLEAAAKVTLLESGCPMLYCGGRLYLSVEDFCQDMFVAAGQSFSTESSLARSTVQDSLQAEVVSEHVYAQLKRDTVDAYNEFWKDREADLQLYQTYCRYCVGDNRSIITYLQDMTRDDGLYGLTREETQKLVVIVAEVEAMESTLGRELAYKYFGNGH